ncbi:MAG TPA: LON peptidase substrate-binding domain-containing protein [Acidimicrobiales bacterium]|nr:LON peptidase substrate-binding domain-containing protein [Acidimicrobiales bacterium]
MTGPGERLPMFPLSTVLFPGMPLPLHVFEPRYRAMVADCLDTERHEFGVVLIERGSEVGGGDVRTDVGTVACIEALQRADDGRYALVARGTVRLRVRQWLADDPYPQALVDRIDEERRESTGGGSSPGGPGANSATLAAMRRVETLMAELDAGRAMPPLEPTASLWDLCARLPVNALDRQRLLAADDPEVRAWLLVELANALGDDLARILAGG